MGSTSSSWTVPQKQVAVALWAMVDGLIWWVMSFAGGVVGKM